MPKRFTWTLPLLSFSVIGQTLVDLKPTVPLPSISNKTPITLVAEKGFWTDYLNDNIVADFTKATGVPVDVRSVSLGEMYQLQTSSMQNGQGLFDVVTIEAGWAKEWASNGYTVPIRELVQNYDPQAEKYLSTLTNNYYPALQSILSYKNEIHSLPYNSYVMGNHFRRDLFKHPQEKANFKKKYGYELTPPQTFQQLRDTAEFFTRPKGTQLAGKTLQHDFYGVALMSGNKPHINDELSSILWGMGGKWFVPEYQGNDIQGFHARSQSEQAKAAASYYVDLMQYAIPADENFAFFETAQALNQGKVAMSPFSYNNLWAISGKVNQNLPDAELGISTVAGGKPYHGAYSFAVSYDSKNPEAAYWLLRYVSSFESQLAYAKGGGNPCRLDVVRYLMDSLEKNSPQWQALASSELSDQSWKDQINRYGHFTSTAMGSIYPKLMEAAYSIASGNNIDATLQALTTQITTLQNLYGEEAMLAE
ncbi:ABC transporter substrate-binding protein [Vibrio sp. TRT 21S02]|uniref:ABC transporter substrate-binding protein n=1 Tax=Vibrio sp. TRT 21S02 TaxID=3418507 RepID=UPI003CE7AE4F